ncbi:MAG: MFS transporter [Chloroflexota bacterium]|nr:MFS transporter [Chloroflexota bacterium]MDE2942081.1 MFS transporter [Chloroflexota bacterium]MDE3268139.1 MFS transporter [Chloroflexota bacterium]
MAAFVESIPGVRRVFYGWWIVAVGISIAILNGAFYTYGFGIYFVPLLHELGASRAALGGVVGLARLEGGLIAPLAGWLIDRYGPRPLLYFGIITMGFAFFLLSWVTSLWMLYAVFMVIATASSFGGGRPINVAVANWFVRKRARALGILLAGIGLGGSAVVVVGWLTQMYGWRSAAVMAGLAYWLVGIPLVSLVHHRPEQVGMHPDGEPLPVEAPSRDRSGSHEPLEIELTPRQALRSLSFWMLAIAFASWSVTVTVAAIYHVPFLIEEMGATPVYAAWLASITLLISVPGRVIFGWIGDYLNIRVLLALLLLVQGIGVLAMSLIPSLGWAPLYILLLGPAYGGSAALRQAIVAHFYGRRNFGTISGLLQFVDLPGTVSGPIFVGFMVDTFDSYRLGFQIVALFLALGAVSLFIARRPRLPLEPVEAEAGGSSPSAEPNERPS